ncbi:MAG TPA: DUF4235 domain-containing protein [Mycobacteriales bacterium]|nr:DUF4235 domain-containing protein [Mycobacteriales bacterium]
MAASSKVGWKVYGGLSGALAGLAAERVLRVAWRALAGHPPPEEPGSPAVRWGEAAAWAGGSAAAVALARLAATRRAAASWQQAAGSPPPGLGPRR